MEAASESLIEREDSELTPITVLIPKVDRAKLWQLKIFHRVKIQEFVQQSIRDGLGKINL
jgi:hypothetical protein